MKKVIFDDSKPLLIAELESLIQQVCPGAVLEYDNDGQIMFYTGLQADSTGYSTEPFESKEEEPDSFENDSVFEEQFENAQFAQDTDEFNDIYNEDW